MNETIATTVVKKDHPGVYIPPPILYVVIFLLGIFLQRKYPLPARLFSLTIAKVLGVLFIIITLVFLINSIRQFIVTRNTIVPIRPATSLQTTGIYAITRNPMYVGLLSLYIGLACMIGSWWNFILLPVVVVVVNVLVIRKEEKYLEREFGGEYREYRGKVRRWI